MELRTTTLTSDGGRTGTVVVVDVGSVVLVVVACWVVVEVEEPAAVEGSGSDVDDVDPVASASGLPAKR
jgi:hypothetical protein